MKHAHTLLVQMLLEVFMTMVDRFRLGVLIQGGKWVEHSDIVVGPLKPSTPESTCHYVKSHTILDVSCCMREGFTTLSA